MSVHQPLSRFLTARRGGILAAVAALIVSPLALLAPAQAAVSTKISEFPYTQDWSSLTATSTWADTAFAGVEGFNTGTSIALSNQPNTTDVGSLTAEGTLTSNLTIRTGTTAPNADTSGGILAYPNVANKTVALSATGTQTVPVLAFHLDTTGKSGIGVAYDIQDMDSSTDDQPTRVALQYRVGSSGAYTNVPEGYVADATVLSNTEVVSTPVSAVLPSGANNQSDVYVRVITLDNASGSNEHIGIDNISITTGNSSSTPLGLGSISDVRTLGGKAISIQTQVTGGSAAPTYELAGDPGTGGLSISDSGLITGTPTEGGTYHLTVTVTAGEETAQRSFDLTVVPTNHPDHVVISEVWGDGGFSDAPFANDYIELYNPTASPVNLDGWAIAYGGFRRAAGEVPTYPLEITGSDIIPAGGHYLILAQSDPNGGGVALPDSDATVDIDYNTFDYRDGFVALVDRTTAPVLPQGDINDAAAAEHVVDAVGYGPTNTFEGDPGAMAGSVPVAMAAQTSSETSASRVPVDNDTNESSLDWVIGDLSPTNSEGVVGDDGKVVLPTTCDATLPANPTVTIAQLQGDASKEGPYGGPFSPYINCSNVSTSGVVTAVYSRGFSTAGAATCGLCGFYIQTPGTVDTPNASDAVFVSVGSSFTTPTVAIGDAVTVKGKVVEFGSGETLTQINVAKADITNSGPSATAVVPLDAAPATYADREAHEGELVDPTDVVLTDTYNLESQGELGLAAGAPTGPVATALDNPAEAPLQQPGQICRDGDSPCIQGAQTDVKNRGYFLSGGTTYLGSSNIYTPQNAKNSDLPYPFIDETHSARVGAQVTFPQGAVLDFRNKKWFLNPPRSVVATGCSATAPHTGCSVDLGEDVVQFEDTRADNTAPRPAPADANIRFATYNVENFFSIPMEDFAAANPWYASSGKGCEYDYDREGNGILSFQCTNPTGMPTAWDPVTSAVTAYSPALASAPRGAGRQVDLDRQTSKIVTAINLLDADVVALEEIGNPNKLKLGVTNSPLSPDVNNKQDQGQGTAIQWRDETVSYLVDHLNADLPADQQWAFTASPEESTDSTSVPGMCATVQPNGNPVPGPEHLRGTCSYASGQDVIRSAFIYKKASVIPVGNADLDLPGYTVNGTPDPWGNHVFTDGDGSSPFDNAREPFAQYFKPVGAKNDEGFALIVNHFKSKGDAKAPQGPAKGGDKNDPLHGAFNATRVAQAKELMRFANAFAAKWNTDKVFLLGDFNAYSGEDPIHAITDATDAEDPLNFEEIHSDDPKDTSYVFTTTVNGIGYGGAGSLDHILASEGARATNPRTDVWEINANEPDVYDYGRYNTNATNFFDGDTPWRGSDHNPEVVDLNLPSAGAAKKVTDVQILGINDFHGRLLADASDGGAAPLAGAVKSLRGIYGADQTIFASAGDNVGASIFESFTQEDKPALDALNKMDLQVSTVGNHEFDKGVGDLLNRIEQPYDSETNKYGADDPLTWGKYLAANVVWKETENGHTAGDPISDPTKMITVPNPLNPGNDIKIGFVGTVTSDLPSLQSPANLEGVDVLGKAETVDAVNSYAADLKDEGANLVVLLTHEGAPTTDCSTMESAGTAFSTILNGVDDDVDAIISGHTHLEYSCSFAKGTTASNPLTTRPVLQGASYGTALDQLVYSFDATNTPVDVISNNVGVKGPNGALFSFGHDAEVKPIVDAAIADSAVAGARVLGKMTKPLYRSKLTDGTDNRGGESTLGNQVAEIQRWATQDDLRGGAQIAFMNPGGLRADALGTPNGDVYDLTYREAADVQPFANELINMKLTGAQIKKVLEQQWQRDVNGNIPARPFLKLGISKGFTYTYTEKQDPAKPAGAKLGTVTGMWLNGEPIDPAATYSVTVNSFLSTGGDNFWELDKGTDKLDTELTDLQGQVEYMKQYAEEPLQVDWSQRSIRVELPADAPSVYAPGDTVQFDLGSLDMNEPDAVQDDTVKVLVGDQVVASDIPVTHGNSTNPDDHWGTASVSFVLPDDAPPGRLHVVGDTTGTDALLPVTVKDTSVATTVSADDISMFYGETRNVDITVSPSAATGDVTVKLGDDVVGTGTLEGGAATVTLAAESLQPGDHTLTLDYAGDTGFQPSTGSFEVHVAKAATTTSVTVLPGSVQVHSGVATAIAEVTSETVDPAGLVEFLVDGDVVATENLDADGVATAELGPFDTVGSHDVLARYVGRDTIAGSEGSGTVQVTKATPTMRVTRHPSKVVVKKTHVRLDIRLIAPDQVVTGKVKISGAPGGAITKKLSGGEVSIKLPTFKKTGKVTLKVTYLGSDDNKQVVKKVTFKVVKKK